MQTVTIHDKPLAVRRRAAFIGVAIFYPGRGVPDAGDPLGVGRREREGRP